MIMSGLRHAHRSASKSQSAFSQRPMRLQAFAPAPYATSNCVSPATERASRCDSRNRCKTPSQQGLCSHAPARTPCVAVSGRQENRCMPPASENANSHCLALWQALARELTLAVCRATPPSRAASCSAIAAPQWPASSQALVAVPNAPTSTSTDLCRIHATAFLARGRAPAPGGVRELSPRMAPSVWRTFSHRRPFSRVIMRALPAPTPGLMPRSRRESSANTACSQRCPSQARRAVLMVMSSGLICCFGIRARTSSALSH
mmetsp:Transcript_39892/g.119387  ORF Transcript_39892/g.119387 Transcript_39892/m.119387 type:complete len:261 (-) Transcript_39892:1192-1974(-)